MLNIDKVKNVSRLGIEKTLFKLFYKMALVKSFPVGVCKSVFF